MKVKAYLATHFFNQAGLDYTAKLAEQIRNEVDNIDLYVPQENAEINDKTDDTNITDIAIAEGDNKYLVDADILIASLDGVEIDSGVSAEIGYLSGYMDAEHKFCANPKFRMVIGLYTDIRRDGTGDNHFYINLYTKGLVKLHGTVVNTIEDLIKTLKDFEFVKVKLNQLYGGI